MKLALLSGSWPPAVCGVADGIFIYTRFLLEDPAHSAIIITSQGCTSSKDENPRLKILDIIDKWNFASYRKILRELDAFKPDIVHIEYPTKEYGKNIFINVLPALLRMRGYKVVITLHEYSFNLSWKGRLRLWPSVAGADAVLVSDPAYIPDIRKVFKKKKLEVIPIAPNIPSSKLSAGQKENLKKNFAPEGTLMLGYFGFINDNKIILPVLKALRELLDVHKTRVHFLLIGDIFERDSSNPHVMELMSGIRRLGLESSCSSTGLVTGEQAADYLSILDYAVLLYKSGISPRNATFLAAAAQGIKIITTANPAYRPDYKNTYLINSGGDIAADIVSIVLKNMSASSKEPGDGPDLYWSGWNAFVKKHLEVYSSLIKKESVLSG
ncbi:MAG: hypothetical protein ABSG94_07060 [Brevinematales bacterium]|jgi:hypothetical protein